MIQIGAMTVRKMTPSTKSPNMFAPPAYEADPGRMRLPSRALSAASSSSTAASAASPELALDRRLAAEIVGLDLALGLIERAFDLLEAGEGVGDALVVQLGAHLKTRGRRLVSGHDRALARLRVGELCLQFGKILVLLGE